MLWFKSIGFAWIIWQAIISGVYGGFVGIMKSSMINWYLISTFSRKRTGPKAKKMGKR